MNQKRCLSLFLITSFFISGLWTLLSAIGPIFKTKVFLFLLLLLAVVSSLKDEPSNTLSVPIPKISYSSLIYSILIIFPTFFFLLLTWKQEFPFVGDHDFHLAMAGYSYDFWKASFIPVILCLVLYYITLNTLKVWIASLIVFGSALLFVFYTETGNMLFAVRYPGAFHFLLFPLNWLMRQCDWESPLNAIRLTNALAIPTWLLILRPLIIKKWPSLTILPFGIYLFFQKEFVYYFTASYLEPWSLIFVLLATEFLLVFEGKDAWISYLLIGFAAIIKEQSIFVLPFFSIATFFLNNGWGSKTKLILSSIVAVSPFILYYFIRKKSGISRTFEFASLKEIIDTDRINIFIIALIHQLGPSIFIVICLLIALLVLSNISNRKKIIFQAIILSTIFQILFFYIDKTSISWTGYGRFQLLPILLIGSPLLVLEEYLFSKENIYLFLISIFILAFNIYTLAPFIKTGFEADVSRNFFEHTDAPVYLPIKEAIVRGEESGNLTGISNIKIYEPFDKFISWYRLGAVTSAYPQISKKYNIILVQDRKSDADFCKCTKEDEAYLAPFIYFTGLSTNYPGKDLIIADYKKCYAELQSTCENIDTITYNGSIISVLGIKNK